MYEVLSSLEVGLVFQEHNELCFIVNALLKLAQTPLLLVLCCYVSNDSHKKLCVYRVPSQDNKLKQRSKT